MPEYDDSNGGGYQRARLEFIQNELEFARGCVKEGSVELAYHNVARAKELLDTARRAHETALNQLSKLPPKIDLRNLMAYADFLAEDMSELQAEIETQLRQ